MRRVPSLKRRLWTILILAACLPVLLTGYTLWYYLDWHLHRDIRNRNQQMALDLRETIRERILNHYKILMTTLPLLQSPSLSQSELERFLDHTASKTAMFDSVVLVGDQSPMRAFDPPQAWRADAVLVDQNKPLLIGDVFISDQTGYPTLPLAIKEQERLLVGYLNLAFLRDIVEEESHGQAAEIIIADWHGTLIGHSKYRDVMLRQKNLAAQLNARRPAEELDFSIEQAPQSKTIYESLINLPTLGWTISVQQNLHTLFGPVQHPRQILVVGMLLSVLFAILLATPAIGRLLKPMETLRLQTRNFATGNFAIELPKRSYTEINELFASFAQLGLDLEVREKSLCESKEWYQMLFESSNDAIFLSTLLDDGELGPFVEVNQVACRLTGFSAEELLDLTPYDLGPKEEWNHYRAIEKRLRQKHQALFETTTLTKEGKRIPLEISSHLIHHPGRMYILSIARDISERKKLADKIERMAFFDTLTGLPNRRLFMDRLEQGLVQVQRNGKVLALLFLDLDEFKQINDRLGHERGDRLLIEIARRLEHTLRKNDTVGRLSGDEFVVILNSLHSGEEAASVAQKILNDLIQPVFLDERQVVIGSSIGIAMFPQDGTDGEELLRHADLAMYHAKQAGKNTFCYFSQEMNRAALQKRNLLSQMEGILEREEFEIHYQPKINLSGGKVVGMEALLRWNNPVMGEIMPLGFLPLTEETGLIVSLGAWILREACSSCKTLQEDFGADFTMTVNISPVQLQQSDFVDVIRTALTDADLSPQSLELDLPELLLLHNFKGCLPVLEQLQHLGVKLSMDGLGISFAYMTQLKSVSLHALKIHKEFLDGIHEHPRSAKVTEALISMAHHLDLNVVAKGIEKQEQLELLREQRCDLAQGFSIAKPLTKDQLHKYLAEHFKKT